MTAIFGRSIEKDYISVPPFPASFLYNYVLQQATVQCIKWQLKFNTILILGRGSINHCLGIEGVLLYH